MLLHLLDEFHFDFRFFIFQVCSRFSFMVFIFHFYFLLKINFICIFRWLTAVPPSPSSFAHTSVLARLFFIFNTPSILLFTLTQVSSKMNEGSRNNFSKLTQERERGKQRNIHAKGFYVSHYLCQIRFHTGKERQPNITSTDGRHTNCFSFFVQSPFSLEREGIQTLFCIFQISNA